jgi:hypothetical protein
MRSKFSANHTYVTDKKMTQKLILLLVLGSLTPLTFATNPPQKPTWFRYYDNKGVANVSTNVTPNHIKYGYEALDQNMQVIKRNRPYNAEVDIKQAPQRAVAAQKLAADTQLKSAYNNSSVASQKKKEMLTGISKQLVFQQEQLKQLQEDRIMFVRQEREYSRKGQPVPAPLQSILNNNQKNIVAKKQDIQSLQTRYRNTAAEYDRIIARLKAME